MAISKSSSVDGKTVVALVVALIGGVEMRVQVGLMAARLDRIEAELRAASPRIAQGE